MTDISRQINYWINSAIDDLESARILIERNKLLHGLFFCHLVIEKAIKAHVVKSTSDISPRSHNLLYLSEKAGLFLNEEDEIFLGILMKYQLEGRYPDYNPVIPNKKIVLDYLLKTENLLKWLKERL